MFLKEIIEFKIFLLLTMIVLEILSISFTGVIVSSALGKAFIYLVLF